MLAEMGRVVDVAKPHFRGTHCLPGMEVTREQEHALCHADGAASLQPALVGCSAGCAFWASGRLAAHDHNAVDMLTRRSGLHTVLFTGDSQIRQVFVSTIAWLRQAHDAVVDPGFTGPTLYLSTGRGHEDAIVPLLVPLHCALARLDGVIDEAVECKRARAHAMDQTPQLFNASGKPIISDFVYRMAVSQRRASAKLQEWTDQVLAQRASRVGVRLIYVPTLAYSPSYWSSLRQAKPDIVVAGALGAHVPCWGDGLPGRKCSIEKVDMLDHRRFWAAPELRAASSRGNMYRLIWLTIPASSPYARYHGPRYDTWNRDTVAALRVANLSLAARVEVRVLEYDRIILEGMHSSAFNAGVLATEHDRLHFTCIAKAARSFGRFERYPFEAIDLNTSLRRQVLVTHCCAKGACADRCPEPPPDVSGCTNRVNTAVAQQLAELLIR